MRNSTKVSCADIPHVGRGTAAGEWFRRRYWIVVGTTQELYNIPETALNGGRPKGSVEKKHKRVWTLS
jgi:hypothetical protein